MKCSDRPHPVPLTRYEEALVWICDPDSIVNHEIRLVDGRCYWWDECSRHCLIWDIRPGACRGGEHLDRL